MADDATSRAGNLTVRGERTRARIVDVAAGLFFDDGVAGTSIADILEAAEVSASQVYHYFGDKEGLVRAVIAHHGHPMGDDGPLDSVAKLEAWCQRAVDLQIHRRYVGGCELGSLASELAEVNEAVRADLADAFARWEAPVRDGLRAMHARGELAPDARPDELALALLTALQGGILLTQTRRDVTPLRVSLDLVMRRVRETASAHA